MDYDFSETKDKVTITFYFSPKQAKEATIKLIQPDLLQYNDGIISLFKPVKNLEIVKYATKWEVNMEKVEQMKWGSVHGDKMSLVVNDSVYKDNEEEESKDSKSQNFMELLSDIYSKGDDDLKKAMNKSLEESGGTVLSTDWKEVGSKTVKPQK